MHVLEILRQLAEGGRAIITTIHQPSSRLFQTLDKLLLLSQVLPYPPHHFHLSLWHTPAIVLLKLCFVTVTNLSKRGDQGLCLLDLSKLLPAAILVLLGLLLKWCLSCL